MRKCNAVRRARRAVVKRLAIIRELRYRKAVIRMLLSQQHNAFTPDDEILQSFKTFLQ